MINKIRYKLVFNRAHRLNQRGEGLIEIECTQQKRKIYFSTHTYVFPQNFAKGTVINSPNAESLNYALYMMIQDIERIELEYIKRNVEVNLPLLKEAVKAHISPAAKLTDFGTQVVEQSERKKLTKLNYQTLLNEAKKRDIINVNPFDRFRIQQMVSKKGYLKKNQLRKLEQLPLKGKEDKIRDAFLVGCYTGLRFSDIISLRQEHIKDGWLVKKMVKTGFIVEIPIDKLFQGKMLTLLEKYDNNIEKLTKNLASNSEVNKTLRTILDTIDADAKITFHSSRHTFATLLGQEDVKLTTIQKLLGHQKLQTTEIYSEVDRQTIINDIKKHTKTPKI